MDELFKQPNVDKGGGKKKKDILPSVWHTLVDFLFGMNNFFFLVYLNSL